MIKRASTRVNPRHNRCCPRVQIRDINYAVGLVDNPHLYLAHPAPSTSQTSKYHCKRDCSISCRRASSTVKQTPWALNLQAALSRALSSRSKVSDAARIACCSSVVSCPQARMSSSVSLNGAITYVTLYRLLVLHSCSTRECRKSSTFGRSMPIIGLDLPIGHALSRQKKIFNRDPV